MAVLLSVAWLVPLPERLSAPHSVVVEYRDGTPAHVFLAADERWRVPVRLAEVDPAYIRALLALEDKRFHSHPGVDPLAVVRSAVLNLSRGRRVSGASTLTMQLVRVLEPRPRTWSSKVLEALRALQLELRLTKDEVLTAYLEFAPYGRNLEGVEAAALAYFGHRATALSAAEVATLLAVPQNPGRRYPTRANGVRLAAARDDIAARLNEKGVLPLGKAAPSAESVLAQVRATPVPTGLLRFPREAPHAAVWLARESPGQDRIRTTLDAGAQRLAERVMLGAREEARRLGIHNGAAVVVDHTRAEVLALVGNFDFWDEEHAGQLIGFDTPRSPGSTLKPLLYAMAIDRGLSGPEHLVPDVPTTYGTYVPRNYDGQFNGLVRLEEALSRSLNLPFVSLLRDVGVETFLGALRRQGVTSLHPEPGHYGLSAAVGGLALTPLEVAGVYATLAEDGAYRPLRWRAQDATTTPAPVTLYATGAAYLTRRALALKERPDFPARFRLTGAPAHIHWKTGTSFGHRDAWSAGSGPVHTAVVWLGNFDNAPSAHLVGADATGPLLFDLLDGVADRSRPPPADVVPQDLTQVEVCAYSGHAATEACEQRRLAWARRSAVPTKPCPYHRRVEVDARTGLALTPACRNGRASVTRSVVMWPASVRRFLADQHRTLPEAPPLAEGCSPGGAQQPPLILSPAVGQVALLLPGVPPEQQELPLEAESEGGQGPLSWFVDGKLLGSVPADERLWWTPSEGVHEVLVTNEAGLSSRRRLEVRRR
ncbi:MAG: penicillin-binding protein 1C [Myxococcaceae bacterium]|nr:penicillin-binding protein 1C [Myxococcaceae bacterium]